MYWVIAIVVIAVICSIADSGGPFAKAVLACGVFAIAFALISWITGWDFFMSLVKICGVLAVFAVLIPVVLAIFGKN